MAGAAARSSESMPGPSTLPASLPRATAIQPDQSDVSMDFTDIAFPLVVTKPLVDANLGSSQPFGTQGAAVSLSTLIADPRARTDFRDLPQPVPPPFNPADTALSNRLPQPPVPPAQAPPEFPNTSSEEPFRASLSYAEILGARGDPELVVDFASWNQTDLLFSLGLVSHATHDATAAWLPPPSLPHNMPSLPVSLDPPVPSSQSGAVDPQSQAQPATLGEAALPGMRTSLNGSDDTPTGTPGPGPDLGWAAFSQPFPPTDLVDLWMSRGDLDFSAPG